MKRRTIIGGVISALAAGLVLASCAGTPEALKGEIQSTAYLKHNIWYEDGVYRTTNYLVGKKIPINAKVTILDISGDEIEIRTEGEPKPVIIANIEEHSGMDIVGLYNRMFADQPVKVRSSRVTAAVARPHVLVKPGMSKDEVVQAIGYPPAHKTPSLDAETWTYWINRFNRIDVVFSGNSVKKVVN